ncbi:MAG: hypothetical protein R6U32_07895, partial [Candidatus Woesearchaeota archaeon]
AAEAIGAEICGVDMLESAKGPMVIEVNLSPGLQGITEATKVNVAEKIAKHIYNKSKEFTSKEKVSRASKVFEELGIKGSSKKTKEIITNLDFRGNRILLPEVVTDITKLSEKDEITLKAREGQLLIRKGMGR